MTATVATIGFGRKGLRRLIELLTDAEVETVVDIRRRPDSPLAGYARQRDLPFALECVSGIGYEHELALAPPEELLNRYRENRDWAAYARDYERVLSSAAAIAVTEALLERADRIALLCSEATPETCHRRLVAGRMRAMLPDLRIEHLV